MQRNTLIRRYMETSWWSEFWSTSEQVSPFPYEMNQTVLKQMLNLYTD